MSQDLRQRALAYHQDGRPGKLTVTPSKPCRDQADLSLAYTPGVAEPCREIERDTEASYRYTSRGNLVAVVTNGTAVLGLGDIGPEAAKPVMEGKAVLFKMFADIDVFDLEIAENDPRRFVDIVKSLAPGFGGINLEDIKAPECFFIEEELKKSLNIPVFHDDQHGTAVIAMAGLVNALEVAGKNIRDVKIVFSGAGAAAIACANMACGLGATREQIFLVDRKGLVTKDRAAEEPYRGAFAQPGAPWTLAETMHGADVFIGVSSRDLVTPEMLKGMAARPIVFAMANPDPEIAYPLAMAARPDVIMATGRSDYPNQVNNVLGFPCIFRGALDVRASHIDEGMKLAATKALAALAREPVPEAVERAYGGERLVFGPKYLIPKPFDPRVLMRVAPAVAKAAMAAGLARSPIQDWVAYDVVLRTRAACHPVAENSDSEESFSVEIKMAAVRQRTAIC